MATQDKWEKQHLKSIAKYERLIKQIYDKYVQEAARIGADITSFDASNPLAFDDYPLTRKRIEALQKHMASDIEAVVYNGIDEQWALADGKTSALIATAFAGLSAEELEERKAKYLTNRDDAREAFKTRKENGMNISDRVWRYTGQFKEEMEMGIDLGLRDGKSADALSRDLRKYLNNPNMLFRRVRDEHGVLHLSQRAKAYHPGQGVYRSSYKNARRLAATETNIAYRTADHDRVQDLDFVVGIRVNLSNNHTLNGKPFTDICDELSAPFGSKETKGKGCYPKDFKFTGWHPLCRCFITTILKTEEEMDADDERIMSGDEPADPSESKNYVEDVPDNFKTWSKNNAERVERAKSVPYFIRDNQEYYDAAFKKNALTPLELAEQRHAQRTPEQIESIKNRWHERQAERNGEYIPLTDDEAKKRYISWMRSKGISINGADVVVDGGFIHMQDSQHKDIYEAHNIETQPEHDQLWEHKAISRHNNIGGYIQTGNSWRINSDFRKTKVIGDIDAIKEAKLRANGATDDDITTIRLLDKKTQEFSLPVPIVVTRYVDTSALKSIFGFNIRKGDFSYVLSQISSVPSSKLLRADPAYMSASTNELQNVFHNKYDVKLQIEVPPKMPMYFTDNYAESEVVFSRATQLQYISSSIGYTGRKAHIVIRCRMVK